MSTTEIVHVKCHWCGLNDVAFVQRTPWLRYCPVCTKLTYIVDGKVDEAETLARN